MAINPGYFKAGEVANPNGRPKGSRNKRTQEIIDLLQSRGDKDPLDFLSEVISSTNHYTPELKVTAANYLTPYLHSKRSVAAPAPRYIDSPVQVPEFQTVDQAETFLASLPAMLGRGELDSQTALELSTLTRAWISARHEREELQHKLAATGHIIHGQLIRIEGGLPPLPGTDVIMPDMNGASGQGQELQGQELNGKTLDLETNVGTTQLPAPEVDSEPTQDPQP
jgi:hypothetical protein